MTQPIKKVTFQVWEEELRKSSAEAEDISLEELRDINKKLEAGDLSVLGPEYADPDQAQKLIDKICNDADRMHQAEKTIRQRKREKKTADQEA